MIRDYITQLRYEQREHDAGRHGRYEPVRINGMLKTHIGIQVLRGILQEILGIVLVAVRINCLLILPEQCICTPPSNTPEYHDCRPSQRPPPVALLGEHIIAYVGPRRVITHWQLRRIPVLLYGIICSGQTFSYAVLAISHFKKAMSSLVDGHTFRLIRFQEFYNFCLIVHEPILSPIYIICLTSVVSSVTIVSTLQQQRKETQVSPNTLA
jgi:hypothetical protein